MSRPQSKAELLAAAENNYQKLQALIASLTTEELETPFSFSADEKKKEAHWSRDKNLRDILIHLYEWQQLLLQWVSANMSGEVRAFLIQPYNWKNYAEMNQEFWKKHQSTDLEEASKLYKISHAEVIKLAETFTDEELFKKDVFPWVGGSTLGSYFVNTTASHYDWAMKKLKAHQKNCRK